MTISYDTEFDKVITGTIVALNGTVSIVSPNTGLSTVQITGTWTGTILLEVSNDGATWATFGVVDTSNLTVIAGMTANGTYLAPTNGYANIRLRGSTAMTGTATINIFGSDVPSAAFSVQTGTWNLNNITGTISLPTGASTAANQASELVLIGGVTETAPASDTASSGLNGRLQRIAQRLTSLIALIPSTIGIAWFTRLSDGTDTAQVTTNGDLQVVDGVKAGGVHGELTLTTAGTRYEVKVGASKLANRKFVTVTCLTNNIWWGWDNTVTTATGTPLANAQFITFSLDPNSTASIWLVGSSNNRIVRITETP